MRFIYLSNGQRESAVFSERGYGLYALQNLLGADDGRDLLAVDQAEADQLSVDGSELPELEHALRAIDAIRKYADQLAEHHATVTAQANHVGRRLHAILAAFDV